MALRIGAPSKSTSCGLTIRGRNTNSSRIAITVPKTDRDWTRKAVIHCLVFPPLSSGWAAMTGGAIK